MEVANESPEVVQMLEKAKEKLEEVKLDSETFTIDQEDSEFKNKTKSMTKFFRLKGSKSSSGGDFTDGVAPSASKTKKFFNFFVKKGKAKDEAAIEATESDVSLKDSQSKSFVSLDDGPKKNAFKRFFAKKGDAKEEAPQSTTSIDRRSFILRGLTTPWVTSQPSQVNIHQPLEIVSVDDVDETPQEIAKHSEIF